MLTCSCRGEVSRGSVLLHLYFPPLVTSALLCTSVHMQHRSHMKTLGTHAPHCGGLCPGGSIPTVLVMHLLCMFACCGLGRPVRLRTHHSPNRDTRLCHPQPLGVNQAPWGQREWAQVGFLQLEVEEGTPRWGQ